MIKLISHRGNLNGVELEEENHPNKIEKVISLGYDCEVDLFRIKNSFYLGHDKPQYEITYDWLLNFNEKLWIHVKNFEALNFLVNKNTELNYFWHQSDDFTLTSKNFIWTFPDKVTNKNSVIVKLDFQPNYLNDIEIFGICSDYISLYANEI